MKALMLDDKLYVALEEEATKAGRPVSELLAEAVEQWLSDAELDEAESGEVEAADREWREDGGVEAGEFFESVRRERGCGVERWRVRLRHQAGVQLHSSVQPSL